MRGEPILWLTVGKKRSASPQWTDFYIRLQAPCRSRPTQRLASKDNSMQTSLQGPFLYQSDVRSWISSSIASCSVLSWSRTCSRPTSSELSSNVKKQQIKAAVKHQVGALWQTPEKMILVTYKLGVGWNAFEIFTVKVQTFVQWFVSLSLIIDNVKRE